MAKLKDNTAYVLDNGVVVAAKMTNSMSRAPGSSENIPIFNLQIDNNTNRTVLVDQYDFNTLFPSAKRLGVIGQDEV